MFRKISIALAAASVVALTVPTLAADMRARPRLVQPVQQIPHMWNWTGAYIGAQVGSTWGILQQETDLCPGGGCSFPIKFNDIAPFGSMQVGGHVGYRWQMGQHVVLGVEADGNIGIGEMKMPGPVGGTLTFSQKWDASIRGTAGWALGPILPYVTAGLAVAQHDHAIGFFGSESIVDWSKTSTGFTYGAGIAYMLNHKLVASGEWRRTQFGASNHNIREFGVKVTDTITTDAVLAKLALKFN